MQTDDGRAMLERARREAPEPGGFEDLVKRRSHRRRNGRLASAAVALAMSGLVAVGALGLIGREVGARSGGLGDGGGAVAVPQAGPGEFYYLEIVRVFAGGHADEEYWWGTDGGGRIRAFCDAPEHNVPPDAQWTAGETPPAGHPFGDDLSGLSSHPDELREQLLDRSGPGGASPQPEVTPEPGQTAETGGLWRAVTHLLEVPHIEPPVRAALYEVARGLPGVEDVGPVQDPVGRAALGLRLTSDGRSQTLYFDLDTRLYMGSKAGPAGAEPDVYVVVVAAGIVEDLRHTPSSSQLFFERPIGPLPRFD